MSWRCQFWHFQVIWWKFVKFLMSFPNHKSVFPQILHDSSVSWNITPLYFFRSNVIYLAQKEPKCLDQNSPNSYHFWNFAPLFIIIIHKSSLLFSWNFMYFQQKEPINVQIWWNFTWAVESLKFCTLVDSFCKNHIKFDLKKYRRLISHDIEEWCKV